MTRDAVPTRAGAISAAPAAAAVPEITISLVSHRQSALANRLLADLRRFASPRLALILTQNVEDGSRFDTAGFDCPVEVIANDRPKGYGANHNAAFARCTTPYFCVINPDVRFPSDPFPALVRALEEPRAGVAGPLVRSSQGRVEDNARKYPTPIKLLGRLLYGSSGPDYPTDRGPLEVDWLAGMCMFFRGDAYRSVGGFDERYHLYYEDADICRRLRAAGWSAVYCPCCEIVHDAQRTSRRNVRYASHHLASALRFFLSATVPNSRRP